jgi:hypothetical protein
MHCAVYDIEGTVHYAVHDVSSMCCPACVVEVGPCRVVCAPVQQHVAVVDEVESRHRRAVPQVDGQHWRESPHVGCGLNTHRSIEAIAFDHW